VTNEQVATSAPAGVARLSAGFWKGMQLGPSHGPRQPEYIGLKVADGEGKRKITGVLTSKQKYLELVSATDFDHVKFEVISELQYYIHLYSP